MSFTKSSEILNVLGLFFFNNNNESKVPEILIGISFLLILMAKLLLWMASNYHQDQFLVWKNIPFCLDIWIWLWSMLTVIADYRNLRITQSVVGLTTAWVATWTSQICSNVFIWLLSPAVLVVWIWVHWAKLK